LWFKVFFFVQAWGILKTCVGENEKGPFSSANFLEVMVNDEKATFTKLN
jgi:hypothetical protein